MWAHIVQNPNNFIFVYAVWIRGFAESLRPGKSSGSKIRAKIRVNYARLEFFTVAVFFLPAAVIFNDEFPGGTRHGVKIAVKITANFLKNTAAVKKSHCDNHAVKISPGFYRATVFFSLWPEHVVFFRRKIIRWQSKNLQNPQKVHIFSIKFRIIIYLLWIFSLKITKFL